MTQTARAVCLVASAAMGLALCAAIALPLSSLTAEAQTHRRPAAAEARLKAKIAADEKRLGQEHPDLVPSLIALGNFYRYWRRFAEAETALKRALAIQEKSLGPGDPKTAVTLGALAAVYKAQGRAGDAEAIAKRAGMVGPKRPPPAKTAEPEKDAAKNDPGLARGRTDDDADGRAALPQAAAPPAPVAVEKPMAPPPPVSASKNDEPLPPPPPPAASESTNGAPPPPATGEQPALDAVRQEEAAREESRRRQEEAASAKAADRSLSLDDERAKDERPKYRAAPKAAARNGGGASRSPAAGGQDAAPAPLARGAPGGKASPDPEASPAPAAPEPAPPAGVGQPQPDFDVVPVFFGTDRKAEADPKRLRYGAERARALQIGHALVTVPAAHKVPQVERPWALTIPYWNVTVWEQAEDPKQHFTIKEIGTLSKPEFLRLARERLDRSKAFENHAVVFVHGFNTTFDNALYRTAQIAYDLRFDGVPFLYSWPSAGDMTAYTSDRERAEQSKRFMGEFMRLVINETGAKTVSVIAHSMGNLPLLDVLKDLRNSKPDGVVISQVILAAPDVDRNAFEDLVLAFKGLAKGVTLYAASNDRALQISRNIWGEPRAGDVPADGPLVMADVDTIDVTSASTDSLSLNHSGYATHNALLNDIALLIRTGERPPHLRFPILKRLTTGKGDYWQYPGSE